MIADCIDTAQRNLGYVKNTHSLYCILQCQTSSALDLSDLLRSEIVMAVSALDQFVHELITQGMMEIYDGTRPRTEHFSKFPICLGVVSFNTTGTATLTRQEYQGEVVHSLGLRTYQRPDDITQGLHLISDGCPWETAQRLTQTPVGDLRLRLNLVIDQRNAIVHQAHTDPFSHSRIQIWEQDTKEATEFIETIIGALFQHCV